MMRSVLVIAALLLSGCAGGGGGVGNPQPEPELLGRTFLSTSVSGYSLAASSRITLSFPEKGKLSANAGCNHLFGNVEFDGDRMKVSDMGGTDMGCEQQLMDQDDWFIRFLTAGPTFALNGDELVLKGDGTEIKLMDRKVADPDRPLEGQRWTVDTLIDGEAASSVPVGAQAFLEFKDGKVTGNTGCNSLSGDYTYHDDAITFSPIITTKIACPGEQGALERSVLAVLEGTVDAKIDANRLSLRHPDGRGLALTS